MLSLVKKLLPTIKAHFKKNLHNLETEGAGLMTNQSIGTVPRNSQTSTNHNPLQIKINLISIQV